MQVEMKDSHRGGLKMIKVTLGQQVLQANEPHPFAEQWLLVVAVVYKHQVLVEMLALKKECFAETDTLHCILKVDAR